jgi:hypothetical protein
MIISLTCICIFFLCVLDDDFAGHVGHPGCDMCKERLVALYHHLVDFFSRHRVGRPQSRPEAFGWNDTKVSVWAIRSSSQKKAPICADVLPHTHSSNMKIFYNIAFRTFPKSILLGYI